jgi:hypothetical protein
MTEPPSEEKDAPVSTSSRKLDWVLSSLLVGVVFAAFGESLRYGFLNWDDIIYIRDYPEVTAGLS